jgi:hypothetical protein
MGDEDNFPIQAGIYRRPYVNVNITDVKKIATQF